MWTCLTHCQQSMYALRVGRKKEEMLVWDRVKTLFCCLTKSNLDVISKRGPQLFKICIVLRGVTWNFPKVRTIIFQIHSTRLPNRFPPCLLPNILKLRAIASSRAPNAQKHGPVLSAVLRSSENMIHLRKPEQQASKGVGNWEEGKKGVGLGREGRGRLLEEPPYVHFPFFFPSPPLPLPLPLPLELILKLGMYLSSEKEKENCCFEFTSSIKREIRKFTL